MTRQQVTEVLERHEVCQWIGTAGSSVVERVYSNRLAANRPCEDSHSQTVVGNNDAHCVFVVCDGHGGVSCGRSVSRRLPVYIAAAVQPHERLQHHLQALHEGAESMYALVRPLPVVTSGHVPEDVQQQEATPDIEPELLELERKSYIRYVRRLLDSGASLADDTTTARALSTAFTSLDADIGGEAVSACSEPRGAAGPVAMATARSGCVVAAAAVSSGGRLCVASAGDCRAVLGVRGDRAWMSRPLSRPHTADNSDEVRRVCDAHPSSESRGVHATLLRNDRLLGLLAPLRAFGDFGFKWSRQLQLRLAALLDSDVQLGGADAEAELYRGLLTPPYLTAQPEVISQQLTPRDRFLVLASDGVWDRLSADDVVSLVGSHLSGSESPPHRQPPWSPIQRLPTGVAMTWRLDELSRSLQQQHLLEPELPHCSSPATQLLRHALAGCAVGQPQPLVEQRVLRELSVPGHLARQYRDDMTATVVVFNTELLRTR